MWKHLTSEGMGYEGRIGRERQGRETFQAEDTKSCHFTALGMISRIHVFKLQPLKFSCYTLEVLQKHTCHYLQHEMALECHPNVLLFFSLEGSGDFLTPNSVGIPGYIIQALTPFYLIPSLKTDSIMGNFNKCVIWHLPACLDSLPFLIPCLWPCHIYSYFLMIHFSFTST